MTNETLPIVGLAQLYRDRADCENVFDEIKNQWGWAGFVTHDQPDRAVPQPPGTNCGAVEHRSHLKTYRQEFSVPYRYDVHFTRDVFDPGNGTLADEFARAEGQKFHRVQVFLDVGLAAARPGLSAAVGA